MHGALFPRQLQQRRERGRVVRELEVCLLEHYLEWRGACPYLITALKAAYIHHGENETDKESAQ